MSLKVTGVYFSASSAGPGPGKMKATIRASRQVPRLAAGPVNNASANANANGNGNANAVSSAPHSHQYAQPANLHSQSLDYLHLNFEEKRQIIASSLSLVDFLNPPKVKGTGTGAAALPTCLPRLSLSCLSV